MAMPRSERGAIIRLIEDSEDYEAERYLIRKWKGPIVTVYNDRPYTLEWGQDECGRPMICIRRFCRHDSDRNPLVLPLGGVYCWNLVPV